MKPNSRWRSPVCWLISEKYNCKSTVRAAPPPLPGYWKLRVVFLQNKKKKIQTFYHNIYDFFSQANGKMISSIDGSGKCFEDFEKVLFSVRSFATDAVTVLSIGSKNPAKRRLLITPSVGRFEARRARVQNYLKFNVIFDYAQTRVFVKPQKREFTPQLRCPIDPDSCNNPTLCDIKNLL